MPRGPFGTQVMRMMVLVVRVGLIPLSPHCNIAME